MMLWGVLASSQLVVGLLFLTLTRPTSALEWTSASLDVVTCNNTNSSMTWEYTLADSDQFNTTQFFINDTLILELWTTTSAVTFVADSYNGSASGAAAPGSATLYLVAVGLEDMGQYRAGLGGVELQEMDRENRSSGVQLTVIPDITIDIELYHNHTFVGQIELDVNYTLHVIYNPPQVVGDVTVGGTLGGNRTQAKCESPCVFDDVIIDVYADTVTAYVVREMCTKTEYFDLKNVNATTTTVPPEAEKPYCSGQCVAALVLFGGGFILVLFVFLLFTTDQGRAIRRRAVCCKPGDSSSGGSPGSAYTNLASDSHEADRLMEQAE